MLIISVLITLLALLGIAAVSSLVAALLLVTVCVVAIVFVIAPHMGTLACACVAGTVMAFVAFGLATPWLVCQRAPFDNNVCPLDNETRKDIQRSRVKWMITLTLISLGFVLSGALVAVVA